MHLDLVDRQSYGINFMKYKFLWRKWGSSLPGLLTLDKRYNGHYVCCNVQGQSTYFALTNYTNWLQLCKLNH
jgi:hypothetical protein